MSGKQMEKIANTLEYYKNCVLAFSFDSDGFPVIVYRIYNKKGKLKKERILHHSREMLFMFTAEEVYNMVNQLTRKKNYSFAWSAISIIQMKNGMFD